MIDKENKEITGERRVQVELARAEATLSVIEQLTKECRKILDGVFLSVTTNPEKPND